MPKVPENQAQAESAYRNQVAPSVLQLSLLFLWLWSLRLRALWLCGSVVLVSRALCALCEMIPIAPWPYAGRRRPLWPRRRDLRVALLFPLSDGFRRLNPSYPLRAALLYSPQNHAELSLGRPGRAKESGTI